MWPQKPIFHTRVTCVVDCVPSTGSCTNVVSANALKIIGLNDVSSKSL